MYFEAKGKFKEAEDLIGKMLTDHPDSHFALKRRVSLFCSESCIDILITFKRTRADLASISIYMKPQSPHWDWGLCLPCRRDETLKLYEQQICQYKLRYGSWPPAQSFWPISSPKCSCASVQRTQQDLLGSSPSSVCCSCSAVRLTFLLHPGRP